MTPSVCRTAQPFSLNRQQTGFGKLIGPAGFPCFARTPTEGSVCRWIRKAASFRSNPYGHTGIVVIDPPGTETVITDNFEGMPFGRPNDLIVDKKGGVYFTDRAWRAIVRARR